MKKRIIKKRLMGLDSISVPKKEKILPKEAISQSAAETKVVRRTPWLAAASLAAVALTVAAAIVIADTVNTPVNNTNPNINNPAVLHGEVSKNETSADTSTDESSVEESVYISEEESNADETENSKPVLVSNVVTSGRYPGVGNDNTEQSITPNFMFTFSRFRNDRESLVYAVRFTTDWIKSSDSPAYTEYVNRKSLINEAFEERTKEMKGKCIAFIEKYAKEEKHRLYIEYEEYIGKHEGWDYHRIYELIFEAAEHNGAGIYYWPGTNSSEFDEIALEYEAYKLEKQKRDELLNELDTSMSKARTEKMVEYVEEYLNGVGKELYKKKTHFLEVDNLRNTDYCLGEIMSYVAFLTTEELFALEEYFKENFKDDYTIVVNSASEEFATMDNEDAYITVGYVD